MISVHQWLSACALGVALLASNLAYAQAPPTSSDTTAADDDERIVTFRAGGDVGIAALEGENFLSVNAEALLRVWNFRFDIAAPLRFNLARSFALRERDWDEGRDFARIPRCVRLDIGDYNRPADRYDPTCDAYDSSGAQFDRTYFSARLAPIANVTLGHGTLMNAFRNSFDPDHPALGINTEFELWDWVKARYILDDITRPRVMGGRVSLWPMQIFSGRDREWSWDTRPDELELGFTTVADLNAPLAVQSAYGRPIVDGQSNLQYTGTALTAFAADAHYFYIFGYGDREAKWKIALYGSADYVRFLGIADMDMLNAAFRFVALNREDGWDLRIGADYRNIGNRFIPGYFDANYAVNSVQFALTNATQAILQDASLNTTKLQYALSRPDGRAHGFRAYMSAEIPIPLSRTRHTALPLLLYFEDSQLAADATLLVGIGPLQIDQLVAGAQLVRRNFNGLEDFFTLDGSLIRVFGQLFLGPQDDRRRNSVLSKLFVIVRYDRRWNLLNDGMFGITNDVQASLGFASGLD